MASAKAAKKKRTAVALIAVGAALILLGIYFLVSRGGDLPDSDTVVEDLLIIAEYPAYTTVHIDYTVRGRDTIVFDYVDRSWQYTADPKFPLNVTGPRQMATAISKIAAIKLVESSKTNFATYGLDDPYIDINVSYSDGTAAGYIIGDYNSFSDGHYFNIKGTDDVYMISSGLAPYFEYTLYEMIVPDLPTIDITTAVSAEVTLDGEVKSFDSKVSTDLTSAVISLSPVCIDYKPTAEKLAECGFDKPDGRIAVNYKINYAVESNNPNITSSANVDVEKSLVLIIGGDAGDGNVYVTSEQSERLFTLPASEIENVITLAKAEL